MQLPLAPSLGSSGAQSVKVNKLPVEDHRHCPSITSSLPPSQKP